MVSMSEVKPVSHTIRGETLLVKQGGFFFSAKPSVSSQFILMHCFRHRRQKVWKPLKDVCKDQCVCVIGVPSLGEDSIHNFHQILKGVHNLQRIENC